MISLKSIHITWRDDNNKVTNMRVINWNDILVSSIIYWNPLVRIKNNKLNSCIYYRYGLYHEWVSRV